VWCRPEYWFGDDPGGYSHCVKAGVEERSSPGGSMARLCEHPKYQPPRTQLRHLIRWAHRGSCPCPPLCSHQ
jgi:hypothetical protein